MSLTFQPQGLIRTRASEKSVIPSRGAITGPHVDKMSLVLTREGSGNSQVVVTTLGSDEEAQDVSAFVQHDKFSSSFSSLPEPERQRAHALSWNQIRSKLFANCTNRRRQLACAAGAFLAIFLTIFLLLTSRNTFKAARSVSSDVYNATILANDPTINPMYSPTRKMLHLPSTVPLVDYYRVSDYAKVQIQNYKSDKSLIVAIHVERQAGTDFCKTFGPAKGTIGSTPFVCSLPTPPGRDYFFIPEDGFPFHSPWFYNETDRNIAMIRRHYHMVMWNFGRLPPNPSLRSTNWEHPDLISVLIVRDPMERLLSPNGWVASRYYDIIVGNATHAQWWEYANITHGETENFQLRILAGSPCCNGKDTDPVYLEYAKALVLRFSVVMDIACLDQSFDALADLLGLTIDRLRALTSFKMIDEYHDEEENIHREMHRGYRKGHHPPIKERIPFPDVYDFLLARNRLDIELYEWSKSISIVNCANLLPKPTAHPKSSPISTTIPRLTTNPLPSAPNMQPTHSPSHSANVQPPHPH